MAVLSKQSIHDRMNPFGNPSNVQGNTTFIRHAASDNTLLICAQAVEASHALYHL